MTARASTHRMTPRKKVRLRPIASVSEPTNTVPTVMDNDHANTTPAASLSVQPKSADNHNTSVEFSTP